MLGVANIVLRTVGAGVPPPSAQLISRWALDEASGTTATDAAGQSDGSYTGVALQQDPLVEGGSGTSVRFFGDSAIAVPHVGAYEVDSYSVVVYGQVRAGPGPGANMILVQKDRPSLPGGFHVGIVNTGGTLRPQAYTKDQSANAIWVGSSNGVGQVVPGTAFMLVMTCGGSGTRLYLDKTEIGSTNNHVGLAGNNEQIGIGRYRPGISNIGGFDGWIDEVRLYKGVLTPDAIAGLPNAHDLVIPPIESAAYSVPVVPSAPSGPQIYVATTGSDSSGNGSIGSPYRTIAKALAQASSGSTIVLRAGIYREANLNAGISNLTIKGYHADIAADPLDPDNWPILDGGIDMSSVSWELVHAGRQEYRTTAANLVGSNAKFGAAIYPGTGAYEIPRYEPLGGWFEPVKVRRLPAYAKQPSSGAWSFDDAFRGGTSTKATAHAFYHEPGVALGSDNRVHIRLQEQFSHTTAGLDLDPFNGDYNPANHSVFLWQAGRTLFSSLGNDAAVEGLFIRNYDCIYDGTDVNLTIRRNVVWPTHNQNSAIVWRNGSGSTLTIKHNVWVCGLPEQHIWASGKGEGYQALVGANMGRIYILGGTDDGIYNVFIEDNLIIRAFDIFFGGASNANTVLRISHNAGSIIDDVNQLPMTANRQRVDHNYFFGPAYGASDSSTGTNPQKYIDHNLIVCGMFYVYRPNEIAFHSIHTPHSSGGNDPLHFYYNTLVQHQPAFEAGNATRMGFPHGGSTGSHGPYSLMNNICCVVVHQNPGAFSGSAPRNWDRGRDSNNSSRRFRTDGNAFFQKLLDGKSAGALFIDFDGADRATLAAYKASAGFTASQSWYAPGLENSSIQADPGWGNSAYVINGQSLDGVPASTFIPSTSSYHSGAVNITSFGWPDATSHVAYRGALNPSGDGTEVGPRVAS
jgi:hypothetical protein